MFFLLSLFAALLLLLLRVPGERFIPLLRGVATIAFYMLCILSGHVAHQEALRHKVQVGTERVGHGGFLADDYYTEDPVYDVSSTWLLIVLGMPILAVVLLRFFNRQARLHPLIAAGYMFYLIGSIFLPPWISPW
jgi:hypothetical protein